MRHQKLKWGTAIVCTLLFAWIALFLDALTPVDAWVYQLISSLHSSFATAFFQGCSALASPLALLAICFAAVFLIRNREYRVPMLLNLILSVLLNLGIKDIFARIRPTEVMVLVTESGYSFPSGHTMAATCFYGFFIFIALRLVRSKSLLMLSRLIFPLLIVLIGISRIYLGVHYFSDVFAGFCVSIAYLLVFTTFVKKYVEHAKTIELGVQGHVPLRRSFSFAFEGIEAGLKNERNMVIHFGIMALVVVFGVLFQISTLEWILCIFLFGLIFMAELLNTAIETVVNMIAPDFDPHAKIAKDTSAGAVLAISIAAAIIGAIIFLPKLIAVLQSAGMSAPKL